jgi:hypothetical protein
MKGGFQGCVEGLSKSAGCHEIYREARGTKLAKVASVNFICPSEEARRASNAAADLGFEEIERVRDLIGS